MALYRWWWFALPGLVAAIVALPAAAIDDADLADALAEERLFVEEGAADVNGIALRRAITDAARMEIDLRVAILARPGDANPIASSLLEALGEGTVLVITADAYGVRSADADRSRVERALDRAGELLDAGQIEKGVAAFVAELDPVDTGRWLAAVGAGIAFALLLATAGAVRQGRRRGSRADRIDRAHQELADRLRAIEQALAAVAPQVEASHHPQVAVAYARAKAAHDQARRRFDVAGDLDLVAATAETVKAESALEALKELLG